MTSNFAFIQAASGLEKFLIGSKSPGVLKDSNVAQISAAFYYEAQVLAKLETSKAFKNKFQNVIFKQIDKDFGEYIDSQARTKPKTLHHVYEWNEVGNKSSRLFKLKNLSGDGLSFKINYNFELSKKSVPNNISKKKYVFANKAKIMEAGTPVTITPRLAKRLVFEINGIVTFMPNGASVVVKNPGGKPQRNAFTLSYSRFFSGRLVNESIKKSGFQQIFNQEIAKALKVPAQIKKIQYSFSANAIRSQADAALELSFGGSML